MKLIVGLGNPGKEYEGTRHNAGFLMVEKMAGGEKFRLDKKMEAEIAKKGDTLLVKPQTYMNDSGRAVRKIIDFYKINLSDLIVIHDDLDIDLGLWKIQKGIGPKIHNGVNSVEECVGDKDFWRLRIGIDNRKKELTRLSGADYVLARFSNEEEAELKMIFDKLQDELTKGNSVNG